VSEAAGGAIEDGFLRVCLSEIVSMTAIGNLPSRRVMERLGMEQSIELEHPSRSTPKDDEGDNAEIDPVRTSTRV
jgi:RimJ/RimL family protein N-acetyltransferase